MMVDPRPGREGLTLWLAGPTVQPMADPLVRLDKVSKTYRIGDEPITALSEVDLAVTAGDYIAVTGPSGSGKSTLANVIGGLDRPDSGAIYVEGRDLARVSDRAISDYRNRTIGFVFQAFNLQPHLTAMENVLVPLVVAEMGRKQRVARARECLEQVGLGDRTAHLSTQLSGGQRQRVSIARALANNPKILIADEATGNLDSHRGAEIMELLEGLNAGGLTLLVITHDNDIAARARRRLAIHDGVLSEQTPPTGAAA
jgi:putative ABC transport system ATP-binding protein